MAGLYDRLIADTDNVAVHLLTAAFVANEAGWFSPAQILSALDARLETPLNSAAQTDLSNIAAQMAAKSAVGKVAYMHQIESIAIILEENPNAFTDAEFRTHLGIA